MQLPSNTCVRYIFGLRRDAHITLYRRKLGWLRIDICRWYFAAIMTYKIMRMGQPSYLKKLFTEYRYTRPARSEIKQLEVPFMGYGRGNLSFQVRSAQFWNNLPSSILFLPSSLFRFKKSIRQHLFELDAQPSVNSRCLPGRMLTHAYLQIHLQYSQHNTAILTVPNLPKSLCCIVVWIDNSI